MCEIYPDQRKNELQRKNMFVKIPVIPSFFWKSKKNLLLCFLLLIVSKSVLAQKQQIRTVDVKIAVDEGYRSRQGWLSEIKSMLAHSSREFEKRFGIKFQIKNFEPWNPSGSHNSMSKLLEDLRNNILKEEREVVIGFTSQLQLKHDLLGLASYLNGYMLIRWSRSEYAIRTTLWHELCHLFGAIDLEEEDSIMSRRNPGEKFDKFTSQIILLNKYRSFNPNTFPLPAKEIDRAISLYSQRKMLNRRENSIHVLLAALYSEKKDYQTTIRECRQALQTNPDSPELHYLLGIAYQSTGELDNAIQQYLKVIQLQRESPEVHNNLGAAYNIKGMPDEAIREFKKAIQLSPHYHQAHTNLAGVYLKMGREEEAIQASRKAIEINSEYSLAYFNLGFANFNLDRYEEAQEAWLKTISLDPTLPEPYNLLGVLSEKKEEREKAERYYLKAVELNPDYVVAHLNLGNLYFSKRQLLESANHYNKVLEIESESALAHNNLAVIYFYQRKFALAWEHLKKAEKLGFKVHPEFKNQLLKELSENDVRDRKKSTAPHV